MIDAKILICYNSPVSIFPIYNGKPRAVSGKPGADAKVNDLSESGFSREIGKIKKSLQENFSDVKSFAVDRNVERTIKKLTSYSPDVIFNFVESIEGIASYEYYVAALFELLGFQFTGNGPACLGNCLNKYRTKNILKSFGINTPNAITVKPSEKLFENNLFAAQGGKKINFPVILKLLNEDASIGISENSVVSDYKNLKRQLKFLHNTYKQDVLIEEYIEGRELNIAILGEKALPVSEIQFKGLPEGLPKIVTYDGKWIEDSIYYEFTKPRCPAILNKKTQKKLEEIALLAYHAMNCRDYARVDVRLDKNNIPHVIEVNPNPDISTDSGFARAAAAGGLSYSQMLAEIAKYALKRYQNDQKTKAV
ncbi:MAG: ATP-grasp domain-containing protein [Ignavibacteriaceae bacterium]